MKLIKQLFDYLFGEKKEDYIIIEFDESDALIQFEVDKKKYLLDLNWENNTMDIEFTYIGDIIPYSTNFNKPYRILNKVTKITKEISEMIETNTDERFHSIIFKSSNFRNEYVDDHSALVRDRFFIRHIKNLYPNAITTKEKNNSITVKVK